MNCAKSYLKWGIKMEIGNKETLMKALIASIALTLLTANIAVSKDLCFSWSAYTDPEASTLTIYEAPIVDGAIDADTETVWAKDIPVTETTKCLPNITIEGSTVYWIVAVTPEGAESDPSNSARTDKRVYPVVIERGVSPTGFVTGS